MDNNSSTLEFQTYLKAHKDRFIKELLAFLRIPSISALPEHTTDVAEACTGVNVAVMVGGFPRKEGMERKDVMSKNVSIYKSQASALEKHAAANCKVIHII